MNRLLALSVSPHRRLVVSFDTGRRGNAPAVVADVNLQMQRCLRFWHASVDVLKGRLEFPPQVEPWIEA